MRVCLYLSCFLLYIGAGAVYGERRCLHCVWDLLQGIPPSHDHGFIGKIVQNIVQHFIPPREEKTPWKKESSWWKNTTYTKNVNEGEHDTDYGWGCSDRDCKKLKKTYSNRDSKRALCFMAPGKEYCLGVGESLVNPAASQKSLRSHGVYLKENVLTKHDPRPQALGARLLTLADLKNRIEKKVHLRLLTTP